VNVANPIDVEQDGGATVVVMRGEHDLSTADELRGRLDEVRAQGQPFVVDLTEVTFVDSAVLGVLIAAHDHAVGDGTRVGFAVGSGRAVRKIVDLTGLDAVLPITDTRAEALRAVGVRG
jgi:anti-sigma B factor antagonist